MTLLQFILSIATSLIAMGIGAIAARRWHRSRRLPRIHVFLPDPIGDPANPFYQDGVAQKRGFDQGVADAGPHSDRKRVKFYGTDPTGCLTRHSSWFGWHRKRLVFEQMQRKYSWKHGAYFVITMSSLAYELKERFISWYDDCVKKGWAPPILIVTVASAPGLSVPEKGMVRWYIRSEEECARLAAFLKKQNVSHAGVFKVTVRPEAHDDEYGNSAARVFLTNFKNRSNDTVTEPRDVTAATAEQKVKLWFAEAAALRQKEPDARLGAFVVAYGDTLRATLVALRMLKFDGPVACTSTLTDPAWQPPEDAVFDARTVTVMPLQKDADDFQKGDDRDVVFLFTRETIRRVMQMTERDSNTREFAKRWINCEQDAFAKERPALRQQATSDKKDIIVDVDIALCTQWRWKRGC